ncbi:MAG: GGDEF domain-containing protein [Lachnospiraceae bacterium]
MKPYDKINELFLKKAVFFYDFDLTTGIVEYDIITNSGENYTNRLGLKAPCHFDELIKRSMDKEQFGMWDLSDDRMELNQANLIKLYDSGIGIFEKTFYSSVANKYFRINYYFVPDDTKTGVHVYVSAQDITRNENLRNEQYGKLRDYISETDDIIASAGIGIWHIFLFDGEKPRMHVSPMMRQILGIENENMTEEESYDFWYSRIKKSSLPSVNASVQEMIEKAFSENTYIWIHPKKGEVYARCGGTSKKIEGKGVILRGYHSDVTDMVNAETKQKELLEQALEEVKKQKKLLQEALDNYKEADYDRRRDFLTGLRNRQDMYELLHDDLSGKRGLIRAMFLMDIDDFKKLNDFYGHVYGDNCLKKIGAALLTYAEGNDVHFYRYGGEEILCISFTEMKPAATIAREIVELISSLGIGHECSPHGVVTVSLGYTTDCREYEKMIDKADAAMYMAKEGGKNRFICYESMKK